MKARARAYLAKCDPAISGQKGHVQILKVAGHLCIGFALSDGDAMELLEEYNQRCIPPWPQKDLLRKLSEAQKDILGKGRGYLLQSNDYLPPIKKHRHPGMNTPHPTLAPFKPKFNTSDTTDGSFRVGKTSDTTDTSFQVVENNNDNIIPIVPIKLPTTEKDPSVVSYLDDEGTGEEVEVESLAEESLSFGFSEPAERELEGQADVTQAEKNFSHYPCGVSEHLTTEGRSATSGRQEPPEQNTFDFTD